MQHLFICAILSSFFTTTYSVEDVKLIEYKIENDGLGKSRFRYLTSDGTLRDEQVEIKNANTEIEHPVIGGFYEFITPEGNLYRVFYEADENGFRPKVTMGGNEQHIPTAALITLQGGIG